MCENNSWQPPVWLSNDYLQEVLQTYLKDDTVQITNVDIRPATGNGENYASVMSRIKITFTRSTNTEPTTLSFILKYSYENDPVISKLMAGYDVYNTEMKMYEQILPQLAEILQESGDIEQLCAKTLKVDYERSAIIFEDLSVSGFEMVDRKKGMDWTHAQLVIKKLAKFHAAAAVLNERQNGILEAFDHGILNRHTRGFACIFEYMMEEGARFAKDCPELGLYYHDKLMNLSSHIIDYGVRAYSTRPLNFFTLSHGDLWTNNIMMSYNNNDADGDLEKSKTLKDIMFIDFQMCNWSSPTVDLHYYFNTSLQADILLDVTSEEKLLQYYHSILCEMLKKLKFKGHIPTLHELTVQFEESRILALLSIMASRTIMSTDQTEDADIHSLMDDNERAWRFRKGCFQNKELQTIIKSWLPRFDRLGLLDLQK
ncbi:uncharacterized protein LOC133328768 [Musca vetustissima]|uniref:uncharacterized protein LOC133328768 n=1 Tax=Musca vetustissima TaxID=27455 RepID=UPI002AB5E09E|nr:uncharacterized protein LOC133328768 [Musca vetustissima]